MTPSTDPPPITGNAPTHPNPITAVHRHPASQNPSSPHAGTLSPHAPTSPRPAPPSHGPGALLGDHGAPAVPQHAQAAPARDAPPKTAQVRALSLLIRLGFAFQDRILHDFHTPAASFFADVSGHGHGTL